MAILSNSDPIAFTFGLLGNIISLVVFLTPVPTFIRIFKKKSTEGFDSLPYLMSLFIAMLWIYYASLKSNVFLVITLNGFGSVIEIIYIALYITYAPKQPKIRALRLLFVMNIGVFSFILILTHYFIKGDIRIKVLGWICVAVSTCVYASPLSVMGQIIRTKCVEFMPFSLSFAFTISAVVWLAYGISLKDLYIALPNGFGIIIGMVQMIIYVSYKNCKTTKVEQQKIAEANVEVKVDEIVIAEIQPKCSEDTNKKELNLCHQINFAEGNLEVCRGSQVIECAV